MNEANVAEQRARLHARARAFPRAFELGQPPPEPFEQLALDLARFQAMAHRGVRAVMPRAGD